MVQVDKLLNEYRGNQKARNAVKLIFLGIDGFDGYNITAPFAVEGETYLAVRVEKRDSEHSRVMFFQKEGEAQAQKEYWRVCEHTPVFALQDPFFTFIDDEIVIGGVEIKEQADKTLTWRTAFFKGKNLQSLEPFFVGPQGMKDLRLFQLSDKRIAVFTRPQGEKGGRGQIGFTIVDSLSELTIEAVDNAPLLDLFEPDEWGGANEIHQIDEKTVGVLGHIAKFSDGDVRHYYPMAFSMDIETKACCDVKIIGERSDFLSGSAKREDLIDVVFSGGIVLNGEEATLYCGTSDSEAQRITIDNPFLKR